MKKSYKFVNEIEIGATDHPAVSKLYSTQFHYGDRGGQCKTMRVQSGKMNLHLNIAVA